MLETIKEAAERDQRSISEELERHVEQSLRYEAFLGTLAGEGPAAGMYRAFQRVVDRVLKMSLTVPAADRGTPLEFEVRTRKEMHAAISVIAHVFAATEERRPVDAERLGLERKPWGQGDRGRRIAYEWLSWEFDTSPFYDMALTSRIDAYWTGKSEPLGALDLDESEKEWRRYQGAQPDRSLADIMNQKGDRDRSADVPAAKAPRAKRGKKS